MKIKIKTDSINNYIFDDYNHPEVEEGIEVEDLQKIEKITISSHNELNKYDIYSIDLQELKLLKNLSSLTMVNLKINSNELKDILELPKLTELCLHNVKFDIKSQSNIDCKNIKKLVFSDCNYTDNIIIKNTDYLKLIGNNSLLKVENVKILDLTMYNLESNILNMKNIDTIVISKNITNNNLIKLSKKCNNLQLVKSNIDMFKLYTLFNNIYNKFGICDNSISQDDFEELTKIAINFQHEYEALFRLALNYSDTNINFDTIETYLIDKLNANYLLEIYSLAGENQLSIKKTLDKLSSVKDKDFLIELSKNYKKASLNKEIVDLLNALLEK